MSLRLHALAHAKTALRTASASAASATEALGLGRTSAEGRVVWAASATVCAVGTDATGVAAEAVGRVVGAGGETAAAEAADAEGATEATGVAGVGCGREAAAAMGGKASTEGPEARDCMLARRLSCATALRLLLSTCRALA